MKIQQGDSVVVISGNEKGKTPRKVVSIVDGGRKLTVEGVNRVFKHVRRGHPRSPQGGRLNMEMPIAVSNVMFYCGGCNKPVRLGYRYAADGAKERFCRSCGASAGLLSPPRPRYASK